MTELKVGIYLPSFGYGADGIDHGERLRRWCVRAEELGFDSLWVTDHMLRAKNMYRYTWIEPMTALSVAAALTRRVTIGPGVLLLPLRHPVLLAKEIASLQQVSGGRFILGAGTGWYPPEMHAMATKPAERGRRTDEVLDVVRQLLAGEPVTHHGEFFSFEDVHIEPSPTYLPVWVGGGTQVAHPDSVEAPRLHPRVARRIAMADGWFTRPSATASDVSTDWPIVAEAIESAGRDPSDVVMAHGQWLHLTKEDDPAKARTIQHQMARDVLGDGRSPDLLEESYLFGTIDEVVESCRQRTEVGVEHLIIHPYTDQPDQLELWGRELLPRLRQLPIGKRPARQP